jgi:hypothetical protein
MWLVYYQHSLNTATIFFSRHNVSDSSSHNIPHVLVPTSCVSSPVRAMSLTPQQYPAQPRYQPPRFISESNNKCTPPVPVSSRNEYPFVAIKIFAATPHHPILQNVSVVKFSDHLTRAPKVLEQLTGQTPVTFKAQYTVSTFGICPKEEITVHVTICGPKAEEILDRSLKVKEYELRRENFRRRGLGSRSILV